MADYGGTSVMVDFVKLYSDEELKELRRQYNSYLKGESYDDFLFRQNCDLRIENNKLKEEKQKAVTLIKDGRFIEALRVLCDKE